MGFIKAVPTARNTFLKTLLGSLLAGLLGLTCGLWGTQAAQREPQSALPSVQQSPSRAEIAAETQSLSPEQQKLFSELAEALRCPTCTGLSVAQSDTPFSLQIRQAVLEQVKQGKTRTQIMDFFTERYGLWILREPPASGLHLFAWLIPLLLFIGGPFGLWLVFWRKRQQLPSTGIRATAVILNEFNQELARLRVLKNTGGQ